MQRLLDRLGDTPVMVVDASGEIIAANPLAAALIGDLSDASWRERNIATLSAATPPMTTSPR